MSKHFFSGRAGHFPSALLTGLLTMGAAPRSAAKPPAGYQLAWKDEFDAAPGTPANSRYWTYETGNSGWGNQELENYVSGPGHGHIVEDKRATDKRAFEIRATKDGKGGYESARLITGRKISFQYGYIEARIQLASGQGIWPAFWMLGDGVFDAKVGWPACGEIDIMENIGNNEWLGKNRSSLHGPGYSGGDSQHGDVDLPKGSAFKNGYHVFGMLWGKDFITFSLDGKPYLTKKASDVSGRPWVFNHPCFFIMNVAVGGNWPKSPDATTAFPQSMHVDYVRVYQKKGDGSMVKVAAAK